MAVSTDSPHVLVVEDDFYLARDLAETLTRKGCSVVGPAGDQSAALSLVASEKVDFAILDLNLGGAMAFPVADALRRAHVPFIFATGYSRDVIPADYRDVPVWEKPFRTEDLTTHFPTGLSRDTRLRRGAGLSAANHLLRLLGEKEGADLRPHVSRAELRGDFSPDRKGLVIFPESGMCSLTIPSGAHPDFEIAMVGPEGVLGAPVWFEEDLPPFGCRWRAGSEALLVARAPFESLMARSKRLASLVSAFHRSLTVQIAWNGYAGSCLPVPQRVARWILMAADRVGEHIGITHAEIAATLGVRRAGVTTSLHLLEGEGLLRSRRSLVTIRDRMALERFVGASYGAPERTYRERIGGDWCARRGS